MRGRYSTGVKDNFDAPPLANAGSGTGGVQNILAGANITVTDDGLGVFTIEATVPTPANAFGVVRVGSELFPATADTPSDVLTFFAGTGIQIQHTSFADEMTFVNTAPDQIVSLTGTGGITVTGGYPNFTIDGSGAGGGGGGGGSLEVLDEGVQIAPSATSLNFVGAGVTAVNTGSDVTVSIDVGGTVFSEDAPEDAYGVTSSADQALTNNAFTINDFDAELFNTAPSMYTNDGAGRVTVTEAGIYSIDAGAVLQAGAVAAINQSGLGIFINGELVALDAETQTVAVNDFKAFNVAATVTLEAGDIVDVRTYSASAVGGNFLRRTVPVIFGATVTQVNRLTIVRQEKAVINSIDTFDFGTFGAPSVITLDLGGF